MGPGRRLKGGGLPNPQGPAAVKLSRFAFQPFLLQLGYTRSVREAPCFLEGTGMRDGWGGAETNPAAVLVSRARQLPIRLLEGRSEGREAAGRS